MLTRQSEISVQEVQKLIGKATLGRHTLYLVKWKQLNLVSSTWESSTFLSNYLKRLGLKFKQEYQNKLLPFIINQYQSQSYHFLQILKQQYILEAKKNRKKVDIILGKRINPPYTQYFVKFQGQSLDQSRWIPRHKVFHSRKLTKFNKLTSNEPLPFVISQYRSYFNQMICFKNIQYKVQYSKSKITEQIIGKNKINRNIFYLVRQNAHQPVQLSTWKSSSEINIKLKDKIAEFNSTIKCESFPYLKEQYKHLINGQTIIHFIPQATQSKKQKLNRKKQQKKICKKQNQKLFESKIEDKIFIKQEEKAQSQNKSNNYKQEQRMVSNKFKDLLQKYIINVHQSNDKFQHKKKTFLTKQKQLNSQNQIQVKVQINLEKQVQKENQQKGSIYDHQRHDKQKIKTLKMQKSPDQTSRMKQICFEQTKKESIKKEIKNKIKDKQKKNIKRAKSKNKNRQKLQGETQQQKEKLLQYLLAQLQ